ncbi:hypothetical protein J5N97_027521 [Dioscorea zingiberensis]|uniref:PUM-HD domain-containing protein n=1 Tax=Dioscorea zingiberensis TaxID=325984 RepID=A0A9D5C4V7_9LILI|nr:hypothetical protein J5N97_027521 [Dioscorea zingiberensis]
MEHDCFELDMLLSEIPDATLVNPRSSDASTPNISLEVGTVSREQVKQKSLHYGRVINSDNSPRPSKDGSKRDFLANYRLLEDSFDQKAQSNGSGRQDYSNLPDTSSLANAFEGMSLKDGVTMNPATLTSVMHDSTSSFNQTSISDNRFTLGLDYAGIPISSSHVAQVGTIEMPAAPSLTTPEEFLYFYPELEVHPGVKKISPKMDVQSSSEFVMKKRPENLPGDFQGQQQSLAEYSGAMPIYPENHAFQFLTGVPSTRVELTSPAIQQQYYLNAETTTRMQPHNLSQFNMEWQNSEGYYDINQQIFYPSYIQNQELQARQIPNDVFSFFRSSTGTTIQPYFSYPDRHQMQQFSGNSYGNGDFVHKRYNEFESLAMKDDPYEFYPPGFVWDANCCGLSQGQKLTTSTNNQLYSTKNFLGPRVLDREEICPEKILTRSDAMNPLTTLRSSFDRIDQSLPTSDRSWMLHSDGHVVPPLNPYLQLDGLNCKNSLPNNFDFVITPKSAQVKYNSIDDVVGKVYTMAKDQIGCRFLQKKFTEGDPEDIEKIFGEIISHIVELMIDPFGNYLVQKLLEVCNEDQRMCILCAVTGKTGELFRISCDMHGTRAVQRVIATVQTAEQYSMIVASLKPFVVALIKNVNGNHVAQRCLQHFPAKYSEFIIDASIAHCVELATDRQGCCVLQKCLHHSEGHRKNKLMSEIASNSLALSQDQFGNYVVQFLLHLDIPWVTSNILSQLEGSYADLSLQKCGSNVVEKCLKFAGEEKRIRIIQELIISPILSQILQDPFGNYVIQTALKECKGALRGTLMEAIRPHFTALRSSPFGKKVLSTILRK